MPTIFGHALAATALVSAATLPAQVPWRVLGAAALLSVLPDFDVVGFRLGIHYQDLLGHRGLSHALLTGLVLGGVVARLVGRTHRERLALIAAALSHGILDAFTDDGLGVAFFAPFSPSRFFFPWRPIRVSPISLRSFLSARGLETMKSEALHIGLPAVLLLLVCATMRWRRRRGEKQIGSARGLH